ncbi:MAG: hyaC [Firmicutes bacterium]|nr:hyaC [Bacillota bacterium]
MKDHSVKPYYVFSPELRIFHWVMVVSIITLFVTGLYIGDPGYIGTQSEEPTFAVANLFSMETMRYVHFVVAFIFVASFILRVYGFVINKGDRLFPRPWTSAYWTGTVDVAMHYTFLRSTHKPYLRNQMARASYAFVYILLFIEAITGFAMYYMIHPNGWGAAIFGRVNAWFGGEYTVHLVHHYIAWIFIIFAIAHVYLSLREDAREKNGEISSMFSGVKYFHEEPEDIGDIK